MPFSENGFLEDVWNNVLNSLEIKE